MPRATLRILYTHRVSAPGPVQPLSDAEVGKVARLARLAILDDRIHPPPSTRGRAHLHRPAPASGARVLGRWRTSARGRTGLTMMRSAPDAMEPFIAVPKVLGEGEGA